MASAGHVKQNHLHLAVDRQITTPSPLSILWAGVQPTLDPYAEAFYRRPIALTLGGEEFSVNDVCKCMRDCRVGWAE